MNKHELINEIAKEAGISKAQAKRVLEITLNSISNHLHKGDSIKLMGFGSFKVRARPARIARDPRTGGFINVEAKKIPVFSPSKKLISSIGDDETDDPGPSKTNIALKKLKRSEND